MKASIIIYGHCQLRTLQCMLMLNSQFNKKFNTFAPNRKQVTDKELATMVKDSDIFIFNNVKSDDKPFQFSSDYLCSLHSGFKIVCTKFWFRQFSLGGYPEDLPYRLLPFYLFCKNYSEIEAFNILKNISINSKEYTDEIRLIHENTLTWMEQLMLIDIKNLKKRKIEEELKNVKQFNCANVSTVEFIEQNSKKHELCYTMNHPTWFYYRYLYDKVCEYLNIDSEEVDISLIPEDKIPRWIGDHPTERASLNFIKDKYPELHHRELEKDEPRFTLDWINKQYSIYSKNKDSILNIYKNDLINRYLILE